MIVQPRHLLLLVAGLWLMGPPHPASAEGFFLIKEGASAGAIFVTEGCGKASALAASELAVYVEKMTGARLPVVAGAAPANVKPPAIVLAQQGESTDAKVASGEADAFSVEQGGGLVTIRGVTDIGVLYGAYDYLNRLGVRWFMPGKLGENVPSLRDLPVGSASWRSVPAFRSRVIDYSGLEADHLDPAKLEAQHRDYDLWLLRNRLQFLRPLHHTPSHVGDFGQCRERSEHILTKWALRDADFGKEPDRFAMIESRGIKGAPAVKRRMEKTPRMIGRREVTESCQPCLVHPANLRATAESVGAFFEKNPAVLTCSISPLDNPLFCDCDGCVKANAGVLPSKDPSRVFWTFANEVAQVVRERFPEKRLAFYAVYGLMTRPPPDLKAEPRLQGIACHVQENNRELLDPEAPSNAALVANARVVKASGAELATRDYTMYSATPQPLSLLRAIRAWRDLGSVSYHCELMGRDEQRNIVAWVQAQLLWDAGQDPAKLLETFCREYYGAAGDAVLGVLLRLDDNFRRAPPIALGHNAAIRALMTEDRIDYNNPLYTKTTPPWREATGRPSLAVEGRKALQAALGKVSGREKVRLERFADTFEMWCRHAEVNAAYATACLERTEAARQNALKAIDGFLEFWKQRRLDETCSPMTVRHRILKGYRQPLEQLAAGAKATGSVNPEP